MARLNAGSLAFEGLVNPLILRTNCSDEARISSSVTGGAKLKSGLIFRHIPSSQSEGLRPSDSPTRALARRFAGSLRSRGSVAALARAEGLRPSDSPTRALARRFAASLRSRGSVAALPRAEGLRPSDSPTRALARRFAGSLRSRGSVAALPRAEGLRPSDSPTRALARRSFARRPSPHAHVWDGFYCNIPAMPARMFCCFWPPARSRARSRRSSPPPSAASSRSTRRSSR